MGIGQNDDYSLTAGTPHLWLNGIKYERYWSRGLTVIRLEESDCAVQVIYYIYIILYYIILYYIILYHIILYYIILYYLLLITYILCTC